MERFSDEEIEAFQKAVDHYYANDRRSNVTSAYIRYRRFMQENHPSLDFMCESTFRRRLRKLDPKKIAYKRGVGSLRAYAKRHAQDDLAERLNKADERLKKATEVGWLEVEDLPNTDDAKVSIYLRTARQRRSSAVINLYLEPAMINYTDIAKTINTLDIHHPVCWGARASCTSPDTGCS